MKAKYELIKGAMDFIEPKWSDICFFYEDYNKVYKPQSKGVIGRFEMRYRIPTLNFNKKMKEMKL